jgi:hypothetical protein
VTSIAAVIEGFNIMNTIVPYPAKAVVTAAFALGLAIPAAAQTPLPTPPMDSVPEKAAPGPVSTDQPRNLSQKLDQTNGVIKPKEVDPAIEKTPPGTHTDDVIKPPGMPGGPAAPEPK